MCLQCSVASVSFGEILPGWYLQRATRDDELGDDTWPKDWWALVEVNDPTFVFETTPELDPTHSVAYSDFTEEQNKSLELWCRKARKFQNELIGPPKDGHRLIEAAKQAGWDRKKDPNFAEWLFHRMARILNCIIMSNA